MEEIINKIFKQNCGDNLKIVEKTKEQNSSKEYLYKGIFQKYHFEILSTKYKIINGKVLNPQIEQKEFIEKIWKQNCGDSLKVLNKEVDKYNKTVWKCEFVNYPFVIIAYKKQIIEGHVLNPLLEKENFIGKIFKQNCGDNLLVIKEAKEKYKSNKQFICKFQKYPYKIICRKDKIIKGSVYNPKIQEIQEIGKIYPQNCGDSLKIIKKAEGGKWECSFVNYPSKVVVDLFKIKSGQIFNPNLPWTSRKRLEEFIDKNFSNKKPTLTELKDKIKLSGCYLGQLLIKYDLQDKIDYYSTSSNVEKNIKKYISSLHFWVKSDWSVLKNQEIDLYIPKLKIGFEYNGNYWHSSLYKPYNYHQEKSLLGQEKNVNIFHIFEYEYDTPLKQLIINSWIKSKLGIFEKKIFARKCQIKELSVEKYNLFCEENHIQGKASAKVKLGLFFKQELVQIISFSKPRFTDKFEWEIIRECSKLGYLILGGKEKLWKYFLKYYHPNNCISYCDFGKFRGNSYLKLGFKFKQLNKPGFRWYNPKTREVLWRNPYKNNELKENEKIFDAGQLVFTWSK